MSDDPYFASAEWRRLRYRALRPARWRCADCRCALRDRDSMRVYYVLSRHAHPELAADLENLRVVCHPCDQRRLSEQPDKRLKRAPAAGDGLGAWR